MNKKFLPLVFVGIAVACFACAAYLLWHKAYSTTKIVNESLVNTSLFSLQAPEAAKITATVEILQINPNWTYKLAMEGSGYYYRKGKEVLALMNCTLTGLYKFAEGFLAVLVNRTLIVCTKVMSNVTCIKQQLTTIPSSYVNYSYLVQQIKQIIKKYNNKLKNIRIEKEIKPNGEVIYVLKLNKTQLEEMLGVLIDMYADLAKQGFFFKNKSIEHYAEFLKNNKQFFMQLFKNLSASFYMKVVAKDNKLESLYLNFTLANKPKHKELQFIAELKIYPESYNEILHAVLPVYEKYSKKALPLSHYLTAQSL
ncbi:MAG: hypothetical protein GXO42_03015 [bacterium]|nr:hypothetical protein [bacterium]